MSEIEFVNPTACPPPVGRYSNVAIVRPGATTIHVAGQLPVDDDGAVAGSDFAEQADLVFDLLVRTLAAAGSSLAEVAFIRAFMVREEDFAGFREARDRAFEAAGVTAPPPATTVVVRGLYGGALIELDAVATRAGD